MAWLRMETAMYFGFVAISSLPFFLSILSPSPVLITTLLVSGAAELAFAFYGFTSCNATYSLCPAFRAKRVRKDCIEKAVNIIRAARIISIGATILVFTGIVEPYLPEPLLFFFTLIAPASVTYGAVKLFRNISFPANNYIISRRLEDYPDRN